MHAHTKYVRVSHSFFLCHLFSWKSTENNCAKVEFSHAKKRGWNRFEDKLNLSTSCAFASWNKKSIGRPKSVNNILPFFSSIGIFCDVQFSISSSLLHIRFRILEVNNRNEKKSRGFFLSMFPFFIDKKLRIRQFQTCLRYY